MPFFRTVLLGSSVALVACTPLLDLEGYDYVATGGGGASSNSQSSGGSSSSTTSTTTSATGGGGMGQGGTPSTCGDDKRDPGEECDGMDFGGDTCSSLGLLGTIDCDDQCMRVGCREPYAESFEGSSVPMELVNPNGPAWTLNSERSHDGVQALVSGNIDDDQETDVALTLMFASPGTISFWQRVSAEPCCDRLRFSIDGVPVDTYSGSGGTFTRESYPVAAGMHTFRWSFFKDGSFDDYEDRAHIDLIEADTGYLP